MNQVLNRFEGPWRLTMMPNAEVVKKRYQPKTLAELEAIGASSIPASVPGNFELDLWRAGLSPDPYFAQNAWEYQQYENRHLWYTTTFCAETLGDADTFLRFEGIDTVADIYLNGQLLGHTENMLIAHELCVNGLLRAENELVVHIYPTAIEARKYPANAEHYAQRYNYGSLQLRKAAYMFGWDIMPRFISGGIWKPVTLIQKPRERLEQFYLFTTALADTPMLRAKLSAFFEVHSEEDFLKGLKITLDGTCGDSSFHETHDVWHTSGRFAFSLPEPRLWYPRNAGEQPLYNVTVRLWRGDALCDEQSFRFGVRTVELIRTSTTDQEGNGEFVFRVNGKRVFCLGTNWVPLDAFPSRNAERLQSALEMLDDLGCNMVRCWGGNVYEDDAFYDFCDERGIMVWQDFGMGCGIYPQDDRFAGAIYGEAVAVIKRLRSHASVVLWAGDNEDDILYRSANNADPQYNRLTREILPRALREHDIVRPYLPSSPYIDAEAFQTKKKISEDHLWGPRDYFKGKYYGESVCHFASETGYHGCPSPATLRRFISKDRLWPIRNAEGIPNDDWICHAAEMQPGMKGPYAYRIGLMMKQVEVLFGEIPNDLDTFARLSQISQAEADKFFIERFRLSKWRRTGILWWNLLDGWPQISDAIVDWYHCKKLAYHYIKRSQAPLCLMFDEPRKGKLALYAVNELSKAQKIAYAVQDLTNGKTLTQGEMIATEDASTRVLELPVLNGYHFLYIEWQTDTGVKGCNHFITKSSAISADQYLTDMRQAGYDQFEGF